MTVNERVADIEKRTGLSEGIIRRVLNGEKDSILESLRQGKRATLIGRCTITPEVRSRLALDGSTSSFIKVSIKPSNTLESALKCESKFTKDSDTVDEDDVIRKISGVSSFQINSLM